MPKRILYIISTLDRCGPVNVLHGIIKHLDREKFEPWILTLSPEGRNSMIDTFRIMGARVECLNVSRAEFALRGRKLLEKELIHLKPDIVHTHSYRADIVGANVDLPAPHCTTIHNNPYEDYTYLYGKTFGSAIYKHHLKALKRIAYPVVVGGHIKHALKDLLPHDIKVIQNGVDMNHYSPVPHEEKMQLRQRIGADEEETVLIYTGYLSNRKNPFMIIKAFEASRLKEHAKLIFVGNGPLRKACQEMKVQNVIFPGFISDVRTYLRAGDVYVSGAKSEGIPMSVIEGMGCGLSVILSEIPAHKEVITESGTGGALFNVESLPDLISCFDDLLEKDVKKLADEARTIAVEKFSSELMSRNYQDYYTAISEG